MIASGGDWKPRNPYTLHNAPLAPCQYGQRSRQQLVVIPTLIIMYSVSESAPASASRESESLTLLDSDAISLPLVFEKHSPLPYDLVKPVWVDEEPTRPMPVRRLRRGTKVPNPVDTGTHHAHDLPPNLTIKLGECIGHGRSGLIFKVQVEPVSQGPSASSPSGSSGSSGISTPSTMVRPPPLVAKIGRQHFNKWLLREAWFYEEMQSLQGVVIPRCYGLYSARIPRPSGHDHDHASGSFVPWPWLEGWRLREFNGQAVSPELLLHTYEKCGGKDKADEREVEGEADMLDYFGDFDEKYAVFVRKFEDTDTRGTSTSTGGMVCTLMLLEELGGPYLPMGRRVPDEMRYVHSHSHCSLGFTPSLVIYSLLPTPEDTY